MLIFSTFGISGALIGMGVYFHFKELENPGHLKNPDSNCTNITATGKTIKQRISKKLVIRNLKRFLLETTKIECLHNSIMLETSF